MSVHCPLDNIDHFTDSRITRVPSPGSWFRAGPSKRLPVLVVTDILKDVLGSYLQEEKYDAELCRQMTKTISEVPFYCSLKLNDYTSLIPDGRFRN